MDSLLVTNDFGPMHLAAALDVPQVASISGVAWDQAWARRLRIQIEGMEIAVLGKEDMITNKRATGRPRDLADLALLGQFEDKE